MKKDRINRKWLINFILVWSLLNFLLNTLGHIIIFLTTEYDGIYSFWGLSYVLENSSFQSLLFAVSLLLAYSLTIRKLMSSYSFAVIQGIILHLIFFAGLKNVENDEGIQFFGTSEIIGLEYLIMYSQQNLIWVLNNFIPFTGNYDHGFVIPSSTLYFYFVYVLLTSLYYLLITFLTIKIIKWMPKLNTDDKPSVTT
jgi:hypothetical protein